MQIKLTPQMVLETFDKRLGISGLPLSHQIYAWQKTLWVYHNNPSAIAAEFAELMPVVEEAFAMKEISIIDDLKITLEEYVQGVPHEQFMYQFNEDPVFLTGLVNIPMTPRQLQEMVPYVTNLTRVTHNNAQYRPS